MAQAHFRTLAVIGVRNRTLSDSWLRRVSTSGQKNRCANCYILCKLEKLGQAGCLHVE